MKKFNEIDFVNDGFYELEGIDLHLYHLSTNPNLSILKAGVPKSIGRKENHDIKRVCLSPSINGCISALWPNKSKFYVYTPIDKLCNLNLAVPTLYECYDSKITKEIWSLDDIAVKCVGCIHIDCDRFTIEKSSNYITKFSVIKHNWNIDKIFDKENYDIIERACRYQEIYKYTPI